MLFLTSPSFRPLITLMYMFLSPNFVFDSLPSSVSDKLPRLLWETRREINKKINNKPPSGRCYWLPPINCGEITGGALDWGPLELSAFLCHGGSLGKMLPGLSVPFCKTTDERTGLDWALAPRSPCLQLSCQDFQVNRQVLPLHQVQTSHGPWGLLPVDNILGF